MRVMRVMEMQHKSILYQSYLGPRYSVGAKWLMDGLHYHVSASVGDGGPVDHDVIGTHRHHPGS